MEYLTEWTDFEQTYKKVILVFAKWQKDNLKITHGSLCHRQNKIESMELTYGLPYTSSGICAELGCTNVQAEKYNRDLKEVMYFRCLRLDREGNVYAVFYLSDSVTEVTEIIGNIKK